MKKWVYVQLEKPNQKFLSEGIDAHGYFINLDFVSSILEYSHEGKNFFSVDVSGKVLIVSEKEALPLLQAFDCFRESPSIKRYWEDKKANDVVID